jgi:hypothetical protein
MSKVQAVANLFMKSSGRAAIPSADAKNKKMPKFGAARHRFND